MVNGDPLLRICYLFYRADLCNMPPSILIHDMDNQVDGASAFRFYIIQRHSSRSSHGELSKSA